MAPERFRGDGNARADIYALGLTLYELLTLRPAFETSDRLEMIERIKTEEPARPRSLDGRIPRDLETIVLKAIEQGPERRYPSAEAMAEDLGRFLADEPIRARQVGAAERYWRWARRNPVIAVLGGVLAAFLVLVTIGSLLAAGRFARLAGPRSARRTIGTTGGEPPGAGRIRERAPGRPGPRRGPGGDVPGHAQRGQGPAGRSPARLARGSPGQSRPADRHADAPPRPGPAPHRGGSRASESSTPTRWPGSRDVPPTPASLAFSADGKTLVSAHGSGELRLWDLAARRHVETVPAEAWPIGPAGVPPANRTPPNVQFLPDGALAYASWAHRVAFLDPPGHMPARSPLGGGNAQVWGLSVDRSGRWLAVGWSDGHIAIHDAATGAVRRTIDGDGRRLALSPDGLWLATRGPDNSVVLRTTAEDTLPITLGRHRDRVESLAFSPDGTTLASTSFDRTAKLWDMARREERLTLRGHKEKLTDIAFSPDGAWRRHHERRPHHPDLGRPRRTVAGRPPWPRVHESRGIQPRRRSTWPPPGKAWCTFTTSPAGASGGGWSVTAEGVQCLAFHPQQVQLASGADDNAIIAWDPEPGRPLRRWVAHNAYVRALAYSADGSMLASGHGGNQKSPDDSVHLWDTRTGALRQSLPGHATGVHALAFDPTGRRLASGDFGGTVLLFDVDSGRILRREYRGKRARHVGCLPGRRPPSPRRSPERVGCPVRSGAGPARPGGSSCRRAAIDSWSTAAATAPSSAIPGEPWSPCRCPISRSFIASPGGTIGRSSRSRSAPTGGCWPRAGPIGASSSATPRPSRRG